MAFGEEVRLARERLGWTQNRLAREAGINQPTLQRIEADAKKDPQLSFALRIAQALGVSVETLARQGDRPESASGTERGSGMPSGLSPNQALRLEQVERDAAEALRVAHSARSDIEASMPSLEAARQTLEKIVPALVKHGILPAPPTRRKQRG